MPYAFRTVSFHRYSVGGVISYRSQICSTVLSFVQVSKSAEYQRQTVPAIGNCNHGDIGIMHTSIRKDGQVNRRVSRTRSSILPVAVVCDLALISLQVSAHSPGLRISGSNYLWRKKGIEHDVGELLNIKIQFFNLDQQCEHSYPYRRNLLSNSDERVNEKEDYLGRRILLRSPNFRRRILSFLFHLPRDNHSAADEKVPYCAAQILPQYMFSDTAFILRRIVPEAVLSVCWITDDTVINITRRERIEFMHYGIISENMWNG